MNCLVRQAYMLYGRWCTHRIAYYSTAAFVSRKSDSVSEHRNYNLSTVVPIENFGPVTCVASGRVKAQQVAMATNALAQSRGQIAVPYTQALHCCFHLPSFFSVRTKYWKIKITESVNWQRKHV